MQSKQQYMTRPGVRVEVVGQKNGAGLWLDNHFVTDLTHNELRKLFQRAPEAWAKISSISPQFEPPLGAAVGALPPNVERHLGRADRHGSLGGLVFDENGYLGGIRVGALGPFGSSVSSTGPMRDTG